MAWEPGGWGVSERNKTLVRSFVELYNAGAWERLDEVVARDYVHHNNDAALSWSQFKRGAAWVRAGMPDFRLAIRDIVAEGDRVAVRLEGRGTHTGSFFGEPPTSRTVVLHVQWFALIAEDLLAEDWEVMDEWDLRRQVGAMPGSPQETAAS